MTLAYRPMAGDAGIGNEQRIFDFEADFAKDLRCIPMVVRFKLDRCGVKLSLRQWSKMGVENRLRLLATKGDTARETEAFKTLVIKLATAHCSDEIRLLDLESEPAWSNAAQVPEEVIQQAAVAGVKAPTSGSWNKLSVLQRFALLKLARSDHDNHNFVPALREMRIPH